MSLAWTMNVLQWDTGMDTQSVLLGKDTPDSSYQFLWSHLSPTTVSELFAFSICEETENLMFWCFHQLRMLLPTWENSQKFCPLLSQFKMFWWYLKKKKARLQQKGELREILIEEERKLTVVVKNMSGHEAWVLYREEKLEL